MSARRRTRAAMTGAGSRTASALSGTGPPCDVGVWGGTNRGLGDTPAVLDSSGESGTAVSIC